MNWCASNQSSDRRWQSCKGGFRDKQSRTAQGKADRRAHKPSGPAASLKPRVRERAFVCNGARSSRALSKTTYPSHSSRCVQKLKRPTSPSTRYGVALAHMTPPPCTFTFVGERAQLRLQFIAHLRIIGAYQRCLAIIKAGCLVGADEQSELAKPSCSGSPEQLGLASHSTISL